MGVQDRDWWRDRYRKRTRVSRDPKEAVYLPKLFRRDSASSSSGGSGGSSHWLVKVVVWLLVLGAVFMAFKYFEQRSYVSLLERQMAAQHRLIQEQKRELDAMRQKPRPKVDFFK